MESRFKRWIRTGLSIMMIRRGRDEGEGKEERKEIAMRKPLGGQDSYQVQVMGAG